MHNGVELLCTGNGERKMERFRRRDKGLVARELDQRSLVLLSLLGIEMMSAQCSSKSRSQQSLETRLSYSRFINANHCSHSGTGLCINFFSVSICEPTSLSHEHNLFVGL
jgi:hypothetical protein